MHARINLPQMKDLKIKLFFYERHAKKTCLLDPDEHSNDVPVTQQAGSLAKKAPPGTVRRLFTVPRHDLDAQSREQLCILSLFMTFLFSIMMTGRSCKLARFYPRTRLTTTRKHSPGVNNCEGTESVGSGEEQQ